VVLLLSENANAATHIEKEIANAFYTGRIIMPFRLDNAMPPRNFLSYLDGVRWFDSANPPTEQSLQAFTGGLKDILPGLRLSHSKLASPEAINGTARVNFANSSEDASRTSRYRISRILKFLAVPASIVAVALLWAIASQQNNQSSSLQGADLQSVIHKENASRLQKEEDALSTPHYMYTRLGLWVPVNPTPSAPSRSQEIHLPVPKDESAEATPSAPSFDQNAATQEENHTVAGDTVVTTIPARSVATTKRLARHRAKPRSKAHDRKITAGSRFREIMSRMTALWRKIE